MNKQDIINRLIDLPHEIEAAEKEVIKTANKAREAKETLTAKEDMLLVNGLIDGKNAETRAAQLRAQTTVERQAVQHAENELSVTRAYLNKLLNTQANHRAIAGLLREVE